MQLDKNEIIDMLRRQGKHEEAEKAQQQLPEKVDHEEHSDLLHQLGVDAKDLIAKL